MNNTSLRKLFPGGLCFEDGIEDALTTVSLLIVIKITLPSEIAHSCLYTLLIQYFLN